MTERERLIQLIGEINSYEYSGMAKVTDEALADFLLENGVRVPPVKACDKIYEICERRKGEKWVKIISERVVHGVEIGINGSMIARCGTTISVFLSDIGKTVFLTREEAENALKECDENA